MIEINVHLHENYVQTKARVGEGLTYVEHGTGDISVPLKLTEVTGAGEILPLFSCLTGVTGLSHPALPGFAGVLDISLNWVPETACFGVKEARYIDPHKGGRSLTSAFTFEALRLQMLKNLFGAVAEQNVDKIHSVIKALRIAAGVAD